MDGEGSEQPHEWPKWGHLKARPFTLQGGSYHQMQHTTGEV